MKIQLPDNYKELFTLAEMDTVKEFIKYEKDDTEKPADALRAIGSAWTGFPVDVIATDTPTACKNWRADDGITATVSGWIAWTDYSGRRCENRVAFIQSTLWDRWQIGAPDFTPNVFCRIYDER